MKEIEIVASTGKVMDLNCTFFIQKGSFILFKEVKNNKETIPEVYINIANILTMNVRDSKNEKR
jgi:hypothetical protein